MGRTPRRALRWLLGAVLVAGVACGGSADPASLRGLVRDDPLRVGDLVVPVVRADGTQRPMNLRARTGELLVVSFGFTSCPDLCPTTLADLRAARVLLGEPRAARVDLAMITVDPDRDRPEVLTAYLDGFAERFHAVRITDGAELTRTQDAFLATSEVTVADDGTVEVAHTAVTYVVDDRGLVVVEWPFATGAATMAHDLGVLFDRLDATGAAT